MYTCRPTTRWFGYYILLSSLLSTLLLLSTILNFMCTFYLLWFHFLVLVRTFFA